MICKKCQRLHIKKILLEADAALERYYNKLRRKNGSSKQAKRK